MGRHLSVLLVTLAGLLAASNGQDNQPPSWNEDAVSSFLRGVSEATSKGTILGTLNCVDPEGDDIYYELKLGTAVTVDANGNVKLNVELDFESTGISYDLSFTCVDYDASGLLHEPVELRTFISPNDANDNAPEITIANPDGFSFFLLESSPIGTELTPKVSIRDIDRSDNAVLDKFYLVCNSPFPDELAEITESSRAFCDKFTLEYNQLAEEGSYEANLRLKDTLDFESRAVFSSKLIAIDGGPRATTKLTSTVNIQVNILDAQDRDPVFINIASANVNEKAQIGSLVPDFAISARDGDFGDKRPVKLTIIEDAEDAFDLTDARQIADGIYESRLVVKNNLDRESISTAYEFTVKVTELDKDTLNETTATATATYSVFVTDFNDNPPIFSEDIYYVNVTEMSSNQPVQINGFRINCIDPDEVSNARYRVRVVDESYPIYSITPGFEFTGFASMFLQVSDSSYLDYDTPAYREQRVVLEAKEINTPQLLSSSTTIMLSLRDINDNSPVFERAAYTATISESVNTFPFNFLNITATDKDSGINGQVSYRLEGETGGLFRIDSNTGRIFLDKAVDYESTSQYVFLAYATDLAETPRQTQVQVTVLISNYNDEAPQFSLPSYQTSVIEDRLVFFNPVIVKATDNEDNTVGITYRIVDSPNNAFFINRNTGELTLRDYLNYAETTVGPNGQPSGQFQLVVEASDNGQPPQTGTVSVVITVIDVNDHAPVVDPRVYSVQLSELAPPGQFITKVNATDNDSGVFGTITFRIGQGLSDNFFVNPSTGVITVGANRVFDFDVQDNYQLQVIASDGGAPQKSATATVNIEILDGNNQQPEFSKLLYYIYVDEEKPVDYVIEKITATDKDSTADLRYTILSTNIRAVDPDGKTLSASSRFDYKNAFGVNNEGGIFIKNKLSRDAANEIAFTLHVRDVNTEEGIATATTQVTVIITGEVNTDITFDQATTVYMNENAEVGYNAITVTARDPNNNAVQIYEKISVPGSSDNFDVKANGRITLTKEIDYEQDPQLDHLHLIVVRAKSNDGTQSATVTATVSIVDVNDNAPQFRQPFYEAKVPETYTYPMEVVTIFASDDDSRSYGPLDFRISGGLDSDDFALFTEPISPGSRVTRRAAVIVAEGKTLDYNRRSQYNLDITVTDNANQAFSTARLNTNTKLIIQIIDENNKSPTFQESDRTLAVAETASVGQSIATLIATDEDKGKNGDIVYSLEPTDGDNSALGFDLFTITPTSGTVRVQQSLLGRGGKAYTVLVRARDQGERPNSGFMRLTINVQTTVDEGNNPKWISPVDGVIIQAPEETPNYVLLYNGASRFFDVKPTNIQYNLSDVGSYSDSFKINPSTGEITITKSLDREIQEFYTLLVYAEDTSDPTVLRSGRQLVVQLTDKDDNNPNFYNVKNYDSCQAIERPLIVSVNENTAANTIVHVLSACDPDVGSNAVKQYELFNEQYKEYDDCREGNERSILRLDSSTGALITKETVDYEQQQEYFMCIRVTPVTTGGRKKRDIDMTRVSNTLDDVAYIHIKVVDQNDNGPRYPQQSRVAVVRTLPEQGPVITLRAIDPDGPQNNVVLYRITSSMFIPASGDVTDQRVAADVFTLRGASGALYPSLASYQSFSGGRFVLVVRASDQLTPTFTDDVVVTIFVYEEGEAMKIILDQKASDAQSSSYEMIRELNEASSRYSFNYLQLSEHRTDDGIEPDKTDICFLAVDQQTNNIMNIRQVVSLLDSDEYRSILARESYQQLDRGLCYPQKSSEEDVKWKDLWWVLVAVAIFVFVCCIILIVLVFMLYDRYRRYMETRQTYLVSQ